MKISSDPWFWILFVKKWPVKYIFKNSPWGWVCKEMALKKIDFFINFVEEMTHKKKWFLPNGDFANILPPKGGGEGFYVTWGGWGVFKA